MSSNRFQFAWPPLTPAVKILLIVYGAIFIFDPLMSGTLGVKSFVEATFYLSNHGLFEQLYLWQPLTYQLLHADFFHLLFNGMVLYFFGSDLEKRWKLRTFMLFAAGCGLGAALCIVLWDLILPGAQVDAAGWSLTRSVGASGAISGLVAAFSLYNWNTPLRLFFTFTMQGKWLLPLVLAFDIIRTLLGSGVSIAGHVGGMLTGLIVTILLFKPNRWIARLRLWWTRRRLKVVRGPSPDDRRTLH